MTALDAVVPALAAATVGGVLAAAVAWARLRRLERYVEELAALVAGRILPPYRLLSRALAELAVSSRSLRALERASRKPRRRYIAFYMVVEDGVAPDPKALEASIRRSVERLAGMLGLAEANVSLAYYDPSRMVGIVRTTNTAKHVVLAALGMVRRVAGKRVLIVPVRTTGTIKRAKRALQL